jgi:hypothetical protein
MWIESSRQTIANTIATEYRDMRQGESSKNVETTLNEMKDELANKRREVAKYYELAAKIRQEEEIIDPDPESSNVLISTSERPLMMTEQTLVEQREKVDKIRNELTSIDKLNPGELMEALKTLDIQDQTVMNVLPLLHAAQADEGKMLGAGLGENHPRVPINAETNRSV